jgi:signal transduction histidine kinase
MKKVYFTLLLFPYFTYGQITISNFQQKRAEIETKIYSNQKEAIIEAHDLLNFAEKIKLNQLIADANSCISYIEMGLSDFDNSFKHNYISFKYNQKLNNEKELAYNYFNFSKINIRKANFKDFIKNAIITIDLAKKTNNYVLIERSYNTMATSCHLQKDFEKGVIYAEKGLALQKNYSNPEAKGYSLAICGLNLSEIYNKTNDKNIFNKAEKYFQEAVATFEKEDNIYNLGWAYANWSYLFTKKDLEKSINLRLEAEKKYEIAKTENFGTLTNLGNLAYAFDNLSQNDSLIKNLKAKNIPKNKNELENIAEKYYKKCNAQCLKLKSLAYYQGVLKKYAAFQFRKNQTVKAYKNLFLSNKINDSIFSQESKNAIAKLESQKEIDSKNHELKLDKILLENQNKQKLYLFGGIGLLAIIGGLLFYQSRKRKQINEKLQILNENLDKKNIELDQANQAKTRFFSILNHDLRGPVNNLIFFLQLQKESPEMLDEESTKRMQDKTMTGAENLLASMEDILQWSKSQMENFKPQPKKLLVSQLFEDTKKVFSGYMNIQFEYQNQDNIEIFTDDNYLKTIIRNLTSNAINVTVFPIAVDGYFPTIVWKAWQENSISYFSISDNGPGVNQDQLKTLFEESNIQSTKSGLGLHLIRDMAKAINCDISVNSKIGVGTTFVLKLN